MKETTPHDSTEESSKRRQSITSVKIANQNALNDLDVNRSNKRFKVVSDFTPSGDQPQAIKELAERINAGEKDVVLLGATGTGKTATTAWLIEQVQRPTLIIEPNKTLAAQFANEFRELFPENAVEYFVSYYDYYQPEAYIARTDTYIEKSASISSDIERLRHKATSSLLTRRDCVVVASVSCIYGLGTPSEYLENMLLIKVGAQIDQREFIKRLIEIQYKRNDFELSRGSFRVKGDVIEIIPAYEESGYRISFFGDEIESIEKINPITGDMIENAESVSLFPASHYVSSKDRMQKAVEGIKEELKERLDELNKQGKKIEAYRLEQRTTYDIEMIEQMGFTSGIENYSRHIDGREKGTPPFTLLDFFPDDFLLILDESHVTVPQIGAMYEGDLARKKSLVEAGFRLPSAIDNRPLKWNEFLDRIGQTVYLSATPGNYELDLAPDVVEQIIRPTGLLDPEIEVRPVKGQIDDLVKEINERVEKNERVLITTLTKKMAEQLTDYLFEQGIKVRYMHSDVETIERIELIRALRSHKIDVLVGINLLREGLDLPEVSLVAILDADKEGFLRSTRSLIQTIGRAARNVAGKVIMYADNITDSMRSAIDETNRRREKQIKYNEEHNITPTPIYKKISDVTEMLENEEWDNERLFDSKREGLGSDFGTVGATGAGDSPGEPAAGDAVSVASEENSDSLLSDGNFVSGKKGKSGFETGTKGRNKRACESYAGKNKRSAEFAEKENGAENRLSHKSELENLIRELTEEMRISAHELRFENAARIRDEIKELKREYRQEYL